MYEELYLNLSIYDLHDTEDKTGCLHPCSYNEYQIAEKEVHHGFAFGLYITYGTLAVTVKKEVQKLSAISEYFPGIKIEYFPGL